MPNNKAERWFSIIAGNFWNSAWWKKNVNLHETSIHKISVFIQLSCFLLCWSHAGNERGGNQRDMEEENERSLFWLSVTVRLDSGVSNTKRLTYLHLLLTLMAFCTANFSHLRSLWRLCHTKLIKVIWRTKLENTELYREKDRLKDTRVHKQTNTYTHIYTQESCSWTYDWACIPWHKWITCLLTDWQTHIMQILIVHLWTVMDSGRDVLRSRGKILLFETIKQKFQFKL